MHRSIRGVCRALPFCLILLGSGLAAQQDSAAVRTVPIDTVVARFEHDVLNGRTAFLPYAVLDLPRAYAARQDSLLRAMEHLALGNENNLVRRSAVYVIAVAGQVRQGHDAVPGVMARLARIYRAQPRQDPGFIAATVRAVLPAQSERAAAVALLRTAAAEPDDRAPDPVHGYASIGEPRTDALAQLAKMGEEGRVVLQAMHRSGEARSVQARMLLDQMAQRGFPVTDAGRRRTQR